jgi:hypothetical protein
LQSHWPKIIKVFLLLFVHKKKFFLFLLLFKIIFSFMRLGSYQKSRKKNFMNLMWRGRWRTRVARVVWGWWVDGAHPAAAHP